MKNLKTYEEFINEGENDEVEGGDPCWDGYEMVGTKIKNGKEVPNCVPVEEVKRLRENLHENKSTEEHIFDADNVRKQLKKQGADPKSIENYIKVNTRNVKPGDFYYMSVGAPGIGKFAYKVTRVKNGNIWGIFDPEESNYRILDPSDVI